MQVAWVILIKTEIKLAQPMKVSFFKQVKMSPQGTEFNWIKKKKPNKYANSRTLFLPFSHPYSVAEMQ